MWRGGQAAGVLDERRPPPSSLRTRSCLPAGSRGSRHPRTSVLTHLLPASAASPRCPVSARGKQPAARHSRKSEENGETEHLPSLASHPVPRRPPDWRAEGGARPRPGCSSDPGGFQLHREALGLSPPTPALPGRGLAACHPSLVGQEGHPPSPAPFSSRSHGFGVGSRSLLHDLGLPGARGGVTSPISQLMKPRRGEVRRPVPVTQLVTSGLRT